MISGTFFRIQFYHTKKCEGTTTTDESIRTERQFYHTKKCEGTTTNNFNSASSCSVLPYQEMRGNYNISP